MQHTNTGKMYELWGETFASIPLEELLVGRDRDEIVRALTPEEIVRALTPEEIARALTPEKKAALRSYLDNEDGGENG